MTPSTFSPDRTAWREAVAEIAEKAKQTLPACNGRVDKAVALVLNGDVELLPDGHAKVGSQSNGTAIYRLVNGTCDCKDFPQAPSGWCKHRIAAGIQKRAEARVQSTMAAELPQDAPSIFPLLPGRRQRYGAPRTLINSVIPQEALVGFQGRGICRGRTTQLLSPFPP